MDKQEIWQWIEAEMRSSKRERPTWPDHHGAQGAIVAGDAGKLVNSCLNYKYERHSSETVQDVQRTDMRVNAVKTIVSALRFLEHN